MGKSQESYNKKEKEKKRLKKKQDKLERQRQRKLEKAESGPKSFEDMISYVDEDGQFSSTPPDPLKKKKIKVEDIVISVPVRSNVPEEIVRNGKVSFFNDEKGYGFIIDDATKESIFVHINNLSGPLQQNDKVSFEIEMGPKGANAVQVKLL